MAVHVDEGAKEQQPQRAGSVDAGDDGSAFVGYNEWAAEALKVQIATDFVYEPDGGEDERGVFVAEDIAPHTQVFSVPLESVLTVRSLRENAALRAVPFFQQRALEREDEQLALALLYEKFIARGASKWAKHIELLPRAYHNVLFFDERERALLEGSNLFFIAQQMEQKVESDYARLRESVLMELFENLPEGVSFDLFDEFFSLDNYKWALSTIWSRFVSLRDVPDDEHKTQTLKAMVPVFDMLNHDPEAEMSHYYDAEARVFKLVSHQHWNAGSQLFINYGALSNHKLLTLYGFVLPDNAFDAIDVWMPMDDATTALFDAKAALLLENGLDHESNSFELTADEVNELLLVAVRIQEIECASVDEFAQLAQRALDGEVVSVENEQNTLTRLIYTLEKMLERFPGSIEDDDALLKAWEQQEAAGELDDSYHARHERMAVAVRRSDKYILSENIRMLKWKLLDVLPKQ